MKVLSVMSKHFDSLESKNSKRRFVELLPTDCPCVPYGDDTKKGYKTAKPCDLYLASSDLRAFAGCGVFHKVSQQLTKMGVSDAFLQSMGVVRMSDQ